MRRHDQNPIREKPMIYKSEDICAGEELERERCQSGFELPCSHSASLCLADYVPTSYLIHDCNCQTLGLPQRFESFGCSDKFI